MPIINSVAEMSSEIAAWRRDIHANPELLYEVHRTAGLVADKLRTFGCDEVVEGIGRTGVVALIHGRTNRSGKVVGLRADMDALPLEEQTGLDYASTVPGLMHACGHDGHTAMVLGAARYLAATRNFDGIVAVIFQPAEEGGAGAKAMCDDGLMDRFGITEVYGLHNAPGQAVGTFQIRPGPLLASADKIKITITAKGGHAAKPHLANDAILIGSQLVTSLQSIVSRNVDPLASGVISICTFQAGNSFNVLPHSVYLEGTARSLTPEVRDLLEARLKELAAGLASAYAAEIDVTYMRDYPVTRNHAAQTEFAATVAAEIVGADHVDTNTPPVMGGEDFAFMLEERPGAFIFMGNGDSAPVHHPEYNFNDDAIPYGVTYFAKLVETAMPA